MYSLDISSPLEAANQTKNRADCVAVKMALEVASLKGIKDLQIRTNSKILFKLLNMHNKMLHWKWDILNGVVFFKFKICKYVA